MDKALYANDNPINPTRPSCIYVTNGALDVWILHPRAWILIDGTWAWYGMVMRSLCCFQLEQDSIEGAKQPIVCRHQKSTASTPHYSWEPRFHGYCTRGLPAVGSKSKPKNVENRTQPP